MSRSKPFQLGIYIALRCIATVIGIGPLRWSAAKGRLLGWLYRSLDRKHYRRSCEHLHTSFPEKNAAAISALAKENYRSIGTSLVELFSLNKLYKRYNGRVHIVGREIVEEAVAEGRGVIIASGHIANWELTGLLMALDGFSFNAIARPIDNPYIERWMAKLRHAFGGTIISKWGAVKGSLKALKRGEIVTVLIDQDGGSDGVMVPFFGRPASTIPLVPILAQRTDAPILIGYGRREEDGSYTVVIEKRIPLAATDSRKELLQATTAACTATLEEIIRREPSGWLWMHRRWKTEASQ